MRPALVAGHLCVDLFPELHAPPDPPPGGLAEVGPLRLSAGGCVANTGSDLAALGIPVQVAADVGDDELAGILLRLLARRGVGTEQVRRREGWSTSYSVVLEPSGRDRSFWHHVGANACFDGGDLDLDGVGLLHLGYPSLLPRLVEDAGTRLEDLLRRARDAGATTSLDLAVLDPASPAAAQDWPAMLARVLPLVDVLSPSLDDVRTALGLDVGDDPGDGSVLGPVADSLVAMGVGVVLLTGGPAGMQLRAGGRRRLEDAGPVLTDAGLARTWADASRFVTPPRSPVRSTLAAGDAASAGLLAGLLAGLGPAEAAGTAARTAAAKVAGTALPPLP